jgi:hypothetical protein
MKTLAHEPISRADALDMPQVQLTRLGIEVLNRENLLLRCVTCGETWKPQTDSSGKLDPGYWVCPKKCNL